MALIDIEAIPEHPDTSPIIIDLTKIKNGQRLKTLLYAEKQMYIEKGGDKNMSDSAYLVKALVTYMEIVLKQRMAEELTKIQQAQAMAAFNAQQDSKIEVIEI